MVNGSSMRRLAVCAVVAFLLATGCAMMKRMRAPAGLAPVTVVIDAKCNAYPDPAYIYFRSSKDPTEVVWYFAIPDDWRAEINGWDQQKYGSKKGDSPTDARNKAELFASTKFEFPKGKKTGHSGKPQKPPFKVKGKWPRWEYGVVIWKADDSEACRVGDPGICVRGAGGACEI